MRKCGIYGWRCTENGKWYIGQSTVVEKRRGVHLSSLRGGYHRNGYLQHAFNKYGEDAFEFHVLEEVPEDMLDVCERAWIAYLRSNVIGFGYNLESGGNLYKHPSERTRQKQAVAKLGKKRGPHSAEHRARISKNLLGKPFSEERRKNIARANSWRRGKAPSPETRAKISATLTGRVRTEEHRANLSKSLRGSKWSAERRIATMAGRERCRAIKKGAGGNGGHGEVYGNYGN